MDNKIQEAVAVLINELKTDPEYYYSWQANIAMAFQDNQRWFIEKHGRDAAIESVHEISNNAAKHFLDLLCKDKDNQ